MLSSPAVEARWRAAHALRADLVRYARRRGLTPSEAEDVASEAILRAAIKADLDLDRAHSWLRVVVAHLAVDTFRARVPHAVASRLRHQHVPDRDPQAEVDDRLEAQWVAGLVEELPGRQRFVLRQRAEGLTCEEIAGALDCSYKTVESLTSRARSTVRRSLTATLGGLAVLRATSRRFSRVVAVPAALGGALAVGAVILPAVPVGPTVAAAGSIVPGVRESADRGVATTAGFQQVPSSPPSTRRYPTVRPEGLALLPTRRTGPVSHGAVTVTRADGNETLAQSALRCLQRGPVVTPDRIGCPQGT